MSAGSGGIGTLPIGGEGEGAGAGDPYEESQEGGIGSGAIGGMPIGGEGEPLPAAVPQILRVAGSEALLIGVTASESLVFSDD